MKKFKKFIYALLILLISCFVSIYYCNEKITTISSDKLYNSVTQIPYKKTGLLLGTGKFLKNGNINPYYQYRINATTELFNAKKIKYVVISGDNSTANYDEPTSMRTDLMNAGIDSTVIFLDYAGFRTFDSMVRLKEVFGQTDVTIISQQFHNERAIFIAEKEGIKSIGFNAQDVPENVDFKVKTREKLARVKVFIDYLLNTKPKFLGKRINIPT